MSFSDIPFAYGPFVPHHVPYQYIGNYFSRHRIDSVLELNTTLEDLSRTVSDPEVVRDGWKLTLRKYDPVRQVDTWWEEHYDAVILANGHYTVPYV
jgi:cation diffusion facilitator CzcD-associated flavoprotein CzcO